METTMEKVNTMELTKHTNRELADLMQGLVAVKDLKGVRFSLQVTKNIKLIKSELYKLTPTADERMKMIKDLISDYMTEARDKLIETSPRLRARIIR